MGLIRNLSFALAATFAGIACAATENAPDILIPNFTGAGVIHGLSNNGKYGVSSVRPTEDGYIYTVGSVIYDLSGAVPVGTFLGEGHFATGANDVTDDGKTVVGSVDQKPGVCRFADGKWTWTALPIPDRSIEVLMEDMSTGEEYLRTFTLNGGEVNAVTPDGKYAVGVGRSNDYEMIEQALMWDLEKMELIEVNSPVTDLSGYDHHQTRFMQVSDDGRYILCWNAFSYGGVVFVFDRQNDEPIYIDVEKDGNGYSPRVPGFRGLELDGISKSLSSNGRYVSGGIYNGDACYIFRFDVWNRELKIYDDGIHYDTTGWTVSKDGLTLGATPAVTPYADGLICTDDFLFTFESLYKDAYGMNMNYYNIDNTGKPTLVSDDGRTVVFVVSKYDTYVAKFKEDILDGIDRINLMSNWSAFPSSGSKMTKFQTVTLTFDNPVETDPAKASLIQLLDSEGKVVANALANGGLQANEMKLTVTFRPQLLDEGKTYTLSVPAGICWVKGHPGSVNNPIEVKYEGRANVPVAVKSVTPDPGSALSNLDINDNPVVVAFDVPVSINGSSDSRPVAHLYIDDNEEPAATLMLDVDFFTNNLVVYPTLTYPLYKGSEYKIVVPEGAVTDISGMGPSETFEISYTGSFVPQMGDDLYLFRSTCDDFTNFLFYDGDKGSPTAEYAEMGFTAEETPWWVVMDDEYSTDMAFASHSCYTDKRKANDWFVIRQLNMPADIPAYLTFQSQSYRKNKTDYLKVYIYENDAVLNQLTAATIEDILANGKLVYNEKQDPGASEGTMAGEWRDNVISLEDYMGRNIYICFLNDNENQSMVMVDNIEVVKDVTAFITITSDVNVVSLSEAPVRGILYVQSELADYSTLSMTLLDGEGNQVSSISEKGLSLKGGDTYNFEFPGYLPLTVGKENSYTIEYILDDDVMTYEGAIRDLAFQPVKRVVLEEYTGRDCQFCPLGMAAMERLESLYGNKLIPLVLHAYSGSDPKGANILGYAATVFMGNTAAPNGRINRRPYLAAPMYSDSEGKYHMTAADVPGAANVWQDEVVEEMNDPAFLGIDVLTRTPQPGYVSYTAVVKSALDLEDQNIRVLGMLLEDGLLDRQVNGVFNISDPLLGEFGQGGVYGTSTFYYYFNNVARGYWGQSANGTPRLIPSTLEIGKEYSVDIDFKIPDIVENTDNIKMAVLLIDESTGKVINASTSSIETDGVEGIFDDAVSSIEISASGWEILVETANEAEVSVYALDGTLLKTARGTGSFSFSLDGYRGMVIVRATDGSGNVSRKFMM